MPQTAAQRRDVYLKRTYGLSLEEYDLLLVAQDGVCAVCLKPPKEDVNLHVEHDHTSSQIRGLTCTYCNLRVIGRWRDWRILYRAALYLRDGGAVVNRVLGREALVPKRKKKVRGTQNKKSERDTPARAGNTGSRPRV